MHSTLSFLKRPFCLLCLTVPLFALGGFLPHVHAEEEALAELRRKTAARIQQICTDVEGVFGVVVEDLSGDERFAVNASLEFPQASAIKVPVLMELYKQAHEGRLDLAESVAVRTADQVPGGILNHVGDGSTTMSLTDLGAYMIVLSDNTATNLLINKVGMENINATLDGIGLQKTRVRRLMIDTEASARGDENLSTPAEAARLMRTLHLGEFVNRGVSDQVLAVMRKTHGGAIRSALPAGVSVAFKPGEIPGVETEWAIVELEHRPYIVIAMGKYGVGSGFYKAMKEVSKTVYSYFDRLGRASPYGAYTDSEDWD